MMQQIAGGARRRGPSGRTTTRSIWICTCASARGALSEAGLVVGGLDPGVRVNRNFRNEGVSTQHNP